MCLFFCMRMIQARWPWTLRTPCRLRSRGVSLTAAVSCDCSLGCWIAPWPRPWSLMVRHLCGLAFVLESVGNPSHDNCNLHSGCSLMAAQDSVSCLRELLQRAGIGSNSPRPRSRFCGSFIMLSAKKHAGILMHGCVKCACAQAKATSR